MKITDEYAGGLQSDVVQEMVRLLSIAKVRSKVCRGMRIQGEEPFINCYILHMCQLNPLVHCHL